MTDKSEYSPNRYEALNLYAPILEQIPEYISLKNADGKAIKIKYNGSKGQTYNMQLACVYTELEGSGEYVFGLWEEGEDEVDLKPVALMTCTTKPDGNEAQLDVSHNTYLLGDRKFSDLDTLATKYGEQALIVDEDYRENGIAAYLISAAYATLEARGIKDVKVSGDLTMKQNPLGILPAPNTLPLVEGTKNTRLNDRQTLVQPERYLSKYTKYSTRAEQAINKEDYSETRASTHLSAPQISMLLNAIK